MLRTAPRLTGPPPPGYGGPGTVRPTMRTPKI